MRDSIIRELNELASENSGEPLTFTLIEHLRDNIDEYAKQLKESKKRSINSTVKQVRTEEPTVGWESWFLMPYLGQEGNSGEGGPYEGSEEEAIESVGWNREFAERMELGWRYQTSEADWHSGESYGLNLVFLLIIASFSLILRATSRVWTLPGVQKYMRLAKYQKRVRLNLTLQNNVFKLSPKRIFTFDA